MKVKSANMDKKDYTRLRTLSVTEDATIIALFTNIAPKKIRKVLINFDFKEGFKFQNSLLEQMYKGWLSGHGNAILELIKVLLKIETFVNIAEFVNIVHKTDSLNVLTITHHSGSITYIIILTLDTLLVYGKPVEAVGAFLAKLKSSNYGLQDTAYYGDSRDAGYVFKFEDLEQKLFSTYDIAMTFSANINHFLEILQTAVKENTKNKDL